MLNASAQKHVECVMTVTSFPTLRATCKLKVNLSYDDMMILVQFFNISESGIHSSISSENMKNDIINNYLECIYETQSERLYYY